MISNNSKITLGLMFKPVLYWHSGSKCAKFGKFNSPEIFEVLESEFGLEIPVDSIFYGDSRVTTWLKKALEKLDNSLKVKVEKCVQ